MSSQDQSSSTTGGQGNPALAIRYAAQRADGKCQSCFVTAEVEAVQVKRGPRYTAGYEYEDSTLRLCANRECRAVREGTLADRLDFIRNEYAYKYFGDYELSPDQSSAVWAAYEIAMSIGDGTDAQP